MSHAQKITFNDALMEHIDGYAGRQGLANFTDAVRALVVLGLAADFDRRHFSSPVNPFLEPDTELLKP